MKEPEYTAITYDTPLHFAQTLARLNPGMVLVHVSGAHTDGSEQGQGDVGAREGQGRERAGPPPLQGRLQLSPVADEAGAGPEERQAHATR